MQRPVLATGSFALSPQQIEYFATFGFLKLPGLFAAEIDDISAAFDEAVADASNLRTETYHELHFEERRVTILSIVDKHPDLGFLRSDPRVLGIIRSLMGERVEYAESDGNVFSCESSWHADIYGAPLKRYHVKVSLYLDPQRADTGAIRMIPGTNFFRDEFAKSVRGRLLDVPRISEVLGVEPRDIPSWTLETDPGDVVVWNYRTVHGSFGGGEHRRLISLSFREAESPDRDG
jgi:hypothetical protein